MIILFIPLIPLIAYTGIAGSVSILYWYNTLSEDDKIKANKLLAEWLAEWLAEKFPFLDVLNDEENTQDEDSLTSEVQEILSSHYIDENEIKKAIYDTSVEIDQPWVEIDQPWKEY